MISRSLVAGALGVWIALPALAQSGGDATRGETVYERCQGCHSLDSNRVGPMHRGVFGRAAGVVPDYRYSRALDESDVVWNADTLDKWLANPGGFIAGSRMGYRLSNPRDRADVIAYLERESCPGSKK